MKLQDLDFKNQLHKSQKVFESYFNKNVDFTAIPADKAAHMLARVRKLISEHRNSSRLHTSERDPNYLKLMVMEQALEAKVNEQDLPVDMNDPGVKRAMQKLERGQNLTPDEQKTMNAIAMMKKEGKKYKKSNKEEMLNDSIEESIVLENDVQQAQVVLAAQDMTDQIQDMLEDATEMQFKDLPALVNSIRNEVGTREAEQYASQANSALQTLVECLTQTKASIEGAQGVLTGQEPVVPGEEETELDLDVDAEVDADADSQESDEDEATTDLERSLGRARR